MTQRYSPTRGEVLSQTEARQASPRKANFRVLIISTALIVIIFAGFTLAFMYATPPRMDGQSTSAPQSAPSTAQPPEGKPLPKAGNSTDPKNTVAP